MNGPQKATDVSHFLKDVKGTLGGKAEDGNYGWRFIPRQKNLDCLADLGFVLPDVKTTLLELTVSDFCDGPIQDADTRGDLWIFGKVIDGKEVYIKIKLAQIGPLRIVKVVSFHFAEGPLFYPCKQGEQR